jgi:hypothetical protein
MIAGGKTKYLLLAGAALVILAFSNPALAQCSMCRAALGGSNNPFFIRNFNIGVLVLLVPPVTIFCSIFVALKRYKAGDDKKTEAPGSNPESD